MIASPQNTIEQVNRLAKQFQCVLDLAQIFKDWDLIKQQISEAELRLSRSAAAAGEAEAKCAGLVASGEDALRQAQERAAAILAGAEATASKTKANADEILAAANNEAVALRRKTVIEAEQIRAGAIVETDRAKGITADAEARKATLLAEIKQLEKRLAAVKAAIKQAVETD